MRTKKSIYNIIITIIYYFVVTLSGIWLRKVFLDCLGLGYVGLDTVFANILSLLALVELGIGPAVTYRLYKPLAEDDHDSIGLLMAVYKKFYRYVAIAVSGLGVLISFFIPVIVNDPPVHSFELIFCYYLYLSSTVVSYFLAQKRSLIVADQRQYVTTLIDIVFNILVLFAKILILKFTGNYILVLVVNLLRVILSNLVISIKCDKDYPYIKNKALLTKKNINEKAKEMIVDIKYIVLHKFCNYVYSSTDGIVISTFMGVTSVGLLANYNMIVSVVNSLFMQCSSSIQSSIGNLVNSVKDNKEIVKQNLSRLSYIYYSILSFCTISLLCLLTPFIKLWIGEEYVISPWIVLVICINMFVYSFYQPIANVYTVLGLFKGDKITSPLAAIVNLVISVLTVHKFGLIGVYIGTIFGSAIYFFMRTNVVYKSYFRESPLAYYKIFLKYFVVTLIEGGITYFTVSFLGDSIGFFVIKVLLCIIIPNAINFILFRKSDEFQYVCSLVKRIINRRI